MGSGRLAGHWPPTPISTLDGFVFSSQMPHLIRGSLHVLGTADIYQALGFCVGTVMLLVISVQRLHLILLADEELPMHWLDATHLSTLVFILFTFSLFFLCFFPFQHLSPSYTFGKMLYYQPRIDCAGSSRPRQREGPPNHNAEDYGRIRTLDVTRRLK